MSLGEYVNPIFEVAISSNFTHSQEAGIGNGGSKF